MTVDTTSTIIPLGGASRPPPSQTPRPNCHHNGWQATTPTTIRQSSAAPAATVATVVGCQPLWQ